MIKLPVKVVAREGASSIKHIISDINDRYIGKKKIILQPLCYCLHLSALL